MAETERRVRRARSTDGAVDRLRSALSPGDTVEYSLTAEIKSARHGNFWVKVGGSTTIRDGEDALSGKERLKKFVHSMLDESAKEIIG